nr:retrovirus-related Pol polyprotein from transposon opus [Tanacetum cinerariifolium]
LKLAKESKAKSSVEEPPELELKELSSHLEYAFFEDSNKLPVITAKDLKDVEKEALINILMEDDYKPTIQSQRRVNPKIHDVIKKEVIKLLDAGYFQIPNDSQNQEKTTFTCPYGIFAYCRMPFGLCNAPGHKISKSGIEVDRAKVDVIAKLPHPTTVKGVRSFLVMPKKLTEALILVVPDWNLPFELMCDASDYIIRRYIHGQEAFEILKSCHEGPTEGHHGANLITKKAIISDRGTHFCNDQFTRVMIKYEDHHKLQLNELSELRNQAYENSVIYKERTKKLHDSKIKNCIFNVFPYGTIELSQPNGPNFKVNGHRVKHYFGGDIPSNVVPDLHTFPMDN